MFNDFITYDDIRTFFRRLPGLFRDDYTAIVLVIANIVAVINLVMRGEPAASILVAYWLQMMIIGFWNIARLIVIARWAAFLYVPIFILMYLSIVNIFGLIAGMLLDDQMRGTAWHQNFSLWNYAVPAAVFFVSHGYSFYVNFIGGREFENTKWDTQIGQPILRAMPMWLAALAGAVIGGFLGAASVVVVLFVLPVKLTLDLLGHFAEHGMLTEPEDALQDSNE